MSESILSDVNLGETLIRDLHNKYPYSMVTIIPADLKVGKKYLCIINETAHIYCATKVKKI